MLHRSQRRRLPLHHCANVVDTDNRRSVCEIETCVGGIEIGDAAVGVKGVAGVVELVCWILAAGLQFEEQRSETAWTQATASAACCFDTAILRSRRPNYEQIDSKLQYHDLVEKSNWRGDTMVGCISQLPRRRQSHSDKTFEWSTKP